MNLLFDFDGTLHQSDLIYTNAFKEVFERVTQSKICESTIRSFIGMPPYKIWKEKTSLTLDQIKHYSSLVTEKMIEQADKSKLYDNVVEVLKS